MTPPPGDADLKVTDVAPLGFMETRGARREALAAALGMNLAKVDDWAAASLYERVWRFTVRQHFSPVQSATLLSIVKRVHDQSTQALLPLDGSFAVLAEELCRYSVQRPPYSVGLWSPSQLRRLTDFLLEEYYGHYGLYAALCRRRAVLDVKTAGHDVVEKPPPVPPLREAITGEEHARREASRAARARRDRVEAHFAALPDDLRSEVDLYIEEHVQTRLQQNRQAPDGIDAADDT